MTTGNRFSLAATLSLSTVVASIFAFAPASNAQVPGIPIVSQDPTILACPGAGCALTPNSQLTPPTGTGTLSQGDLTAPNSYLNGIPTLSTATLSPSATNFLTATSASQYFANGATFPAIVLRNLLDFYGVAIPNTGGGGGGGNIGQIGSQGFQPFNSPRVNYVQYNYCGTGSGNGRGTFTGQATASASCSYVIGAPGPLVNPKAPTPLLGTLVGTAVTAPPGSDYAFAGWPNFPLGVAAPSSPAPLFAFSDATASTSALSGFGTGPAFTAGTDLAHYTNNKFPTRGNPIQVPVFFGAIAPVDNAGINGGVSPNLTNSDLCKIYDGQITDYSQLTAPSTTGLSGPIQLVVRSDSSGTTTAFTAYLAGICNSNNPAAGLPVVTPGFTTYYLANTAGVNLFPTATNFPSATFVRRPGNDGVGDYVATTNGGHGYVEASFAQPFSTNAPITPNTPAPIQAALQSPFSPTTFLTATLSSIRHALANISLQPDSTYPCVLRVQGLTILPTNSSAYPIVTQTYLLAYTRYHSLSERDAIRNLAAFILGNRTTPIQANDQIAQQAGFIILGRGNTSATINPLRQQARACTNSITF